ncbi:MAG TPA: hypothetical protein VKA06_03035 [Spirochaetia bacterium]|nr:hypothetical protein [Spirochaetia bacterium]
MSKSDERRREQELADQARPLILAELRERGEPVEIAREVAQRLSVDETKAYRWVSYIAEDFEARRRRIAALGLAMLWPGMLVLAGGPILSLLGVGTGFPLWALGVIIGLPLSIAGGFVSVRSRALVRETL